MSNTISLYIAGLALTVNSILLAIMLFVGQVILAPILNALMKLTVGSQIIPMSDMTYILQVIWVIIILMEIVCIISFIAVLSRRNEVGYETYY
jgi:hypothetical protein